MTLFGETAFHNLSATNPDQFVNRFSPTVFDSVLIAINLANSRGIPIQDTEVCQAEKIHLLKDSDYQKILSQETMRTPNIRLRIFAMFQALTGQGIHQ